MRWGGSSRFHWQHSCHMWADSVEELLEFAVRLGLEPAWFHGPMARGLVRLPHFDLNADKRAEAVSMGAIELTRRQAVTRWRELGFLHGGPDACADLTLHSMEPHETWAEATDSTSPGA